jgi:hypothetical protein
MRCRLRHVKLSSSVSGSIELKRERALSCSDFVWLEVLK